MADLLLRTKSSSGVGDEPYNDASVNTKNDILTLAEMDDNFIHLQNSKENQLGIPAVSGYILSSDNDGNRSWIEPLMSGTTAGSFLIWDSSTEKWTEETDTIYNASLDSFKWGSGTTANEVLSTAFGSNTQAINTGATAWGGDTLAGGLFATSFGSGTEATGTTSTAWGIESRAHGTSNTAWGASTLSNGTGSTAFGFATISSGQYSTSFGSFSTASGDFSTTWGTNNVASGELSTLFGLNNTGSGEGSTVFGVSNNVSGDYSMACGSQNTVSGAQSFAIGNYLNVEGDNTFVVGFNGGPTRTDITGDRLFVVTDVEGIGFNSVSPSVGTFDNQLGRVVKIETNVNSRTLTTSDYIISCNSSSGVQSYTLPANPETGRVYIFVDEGNAGSNTQTINGNGNNINGSASTTLTTDYECKKLIFNGTEWVIIN